MRVDLAVISPWSCEWKGANYTKTVWVDQAYLSSYKVVFHLHETFDNSMRSVSKPPYIIRDAGSRYGTFEIIVDIYFKTLNKSLNKARVLYQLNDECMKMVKLLAL